MTTQCGFVPARSLVIPTLYQLKQKQHESHGSRQRALDRGREAYEAFAGLHDGLSRAQRRQFAIEVIEDKHEPANWSDEQVATIAQMHALNEAQQEWQQECQLWQQQLAELASEFACLFGSLSREERENFWCAGIEASV